MEQEAQSGHGWRDLLWKEATNAPCRILDTKAGPLFLHDHCPAVVVERLSAESGLHVFACFPEREYQLLLALAKRPDTKLTLAYTPGREIVGQVTLVPAAGWWQDLEFTYEMSLEISSSWRRMGIARQLVAGALQDEVVEELIILGLGLRWHWDTEGLGLKGLRANYQYSPKKRLSQNIKIFHLLIACVILLLSLKIRFHSIFYLR